MPDVNINPSAISNRAGSAAPASQDGISAPGTHQGTPGPGSGAQHGTPAPPNTRPPPPLTTSTSQKGSKPAQVSPRVDVEPLYTTLKAGVGEAWGSYKSAVSRFVLGHLSHMELTRTTHPLLTTDILLHTHNKLVVALMTNMTREPPDAPVAPWVAATDKQPTTSTKPLAGDNAAAMRLKTETMQLPAKQRARIKNTNDDPVGPLVGGFAAEAYGRRLPAAAAPGGGVGTPLTSGPPASATTSTGLSKDQEILKRYKGSLMSEKLDLPTKSGISERVLPIAYEEGLMGGVHQPNQVSGLLSVALSTFLKETLGEWVSTTRTNAPLSDPLTASLANGFEDTSGVAVGAGGSVIGVSTAKYKRRWRREAFLAEKGKIKRNERGLLPVEVETERRRRGFEGDLGVAWELRKPQAWRSLVPSAGERVRMWDEAFDEEDGVEAENALHPRKKVKRISGVNGANGVSAMNSTKGINGVNSVNGVKSVNGVVKGSKNLPNGVASAKRENGDGHGHGHGHVNGHAINGHATTNGDISRSNHDRDEDVLVDEMDWGWGWEGAREAESGAFDELLDGCLGL
ncbi:MAG: hypothetical protein Q9162_001773 [Coniocarpon cinnabarinum]